MESRHIWEELSEDERQYLIKDLQMSRDGYTDEQFLSIMTKARIDRILNTDTALHFKELLETYGWTEGSFYPPERGDEWEWEDVDEDEKDIGNEYYEPEEEPQPMEKEEPMKEPIKEEPVKEEEPMKEPIKEEPVKDEDEKDTRQENIQQTSPAEAQQKQTPNADVRQERQEPEKEAEKSGISRPESSGRARSGYRTAPDGSIPGVDDLVERGQEFGQGARQEQLVNPEEKSEQGGAPVEST
jgi:hypothetical protein